MFLLFGKHAFFGSNTENQMYKKKLSASLTALALFSFSMGVGAVELGDLNVESKLGEPFEAKLEIVDVDPAISPLLVRIAPPSVYESQKKTTPAELYALKMERLSAGEKVVLRVYSDAPLLENRFPLLVEMNAGGTITLKSYDLAKAYAEALEKPAPRVDTADAKAERVLLNEKPSAAAGSAAKETDAEKKRRLALDREQDREFPNRTARAIVRDYIALNGFDASQPMRIQHGMTLWSVSRVYWPSYRGATAEQVLIGFRNQNPAAFVKGNPNQLQKGATLYPPAKADVFAINPMEAFREIHGDDVAVPLVTQNLIDAQLVDAELAGSVADAQDRARTAGGNPQAVAAAGRTALEDQKAERVYERNLMTADGKPLGETRQTLTETHEPEVRRTAAEPAPKAVALEEKKEPAAAAPAEVAQKPEAPEKPAADKKTDGKASGSFNWTWVMGILLLLGFGLFFRSRAKAGSCCEDKADGKPCCCEKPLTLQKEIPPSTDAQLHALKTTVDEAVKNGTTGGAMGAGTAAFIEAKMAEEKKAGEADHSQAAPLEEKAFKADDRVEPVVAPDEPVLSDVERVVIEKTEKVLEKISLDLDENTADPDAPVEPAPKAAVKDPAFVEALDARIQLAEGFIKYGAIAEAKEVFEEVKRRGTPEQKARMNAILATLNEEGAK